MHAFGHQIVEENISETLDVTLNNIYIQVNLIITLSLGSIETERVISELCYNEVIYYRYIAK